MYKLKASEEVKTFKFFRVVYHEVNLQFFHVLSVKEAPTLILIASSPNVVSENF